MTNLRIQGADGRAPTRPLSQALNELDPTLFTTSPDSVWERSGLAVRPRCTQGHSGPLGCRCDRRAHAQAWYDLCRTRPVLDESSLIDPPRVVHESFGPVLGRLPAPSLRPWQERLAEQGEAALEGWSPEKISVVGGSERALELVRSRQRQAAEHLTNDSYDWAQAARTYLPLIRAAREQMVDLNRAQQAEAARAWVWAAEREVQDAEQSLRDRQRAPSVRPDRVAESEHRLAQAREQLTAAREMGERTSAPVR